MGTYSADRPAPEVGVRPLEVRLKNLDDLVRKVESLNQRASDWLAGEASWLAKQYVDGHIGIFLKFAGTHPETVTHHGDISQDATFYEGGVIDLRDGCCDQDQPMFVDVICGDHAPHEIAHRPGTVLGAVGLYDVKDDLLEVGVFPAQIVERSGASLFAAPATRVCRRGERSLQPLAFLSERENGIVVRQLGFSCEGTHKIVKRTAQAPDTITEHHPEFDRDKNVVLRVVRGVSAIEFTPLHGVIVHLNEAFPVGAEVVGVFSCPIELASGIGE